MTTEKPTTIFRQDYIRPNYLIEKLGLLFQLFDEKTKVTARICFYQNPDSNPENNPLILDGEELKLVSLKLDDKILGPAEYNLDDKSLTISDPGKSFELEIVTEIEPDKNTSLEGLYRSSGNYCTQCEAEGFRKITYYLDRPDVLTKFTTRIEGDKDSCPVMLSNGNLIDQGELDSGRHYVVWQDPFPKPCYLFALVAGDLKFLADSYKTASGRIIDLQIFTEKKNRDKCDHAMASLKKAMKWDEEVYGLEYDLDTFMIVAVDDFNMGAMENKGLNIFNSKYVLSSPETATDDDYIGIEGVIAHEYFHNWTGNRVTCRDWFQLSLKEGLTVFRDQEFSSDMNSRAVQRIGDVRVLRNFQFREDSGPMAHPVRPDSYQEINNFYTVTVYNKGAEVIRMIHNLLGAEPFHAGMDLYFSRHDGKAATCDDFVAAMADSSGVDLGQFKNWYSQAGTPLLKVKGEWNETLFEYKLTIAQSCAKTPGGEAAAKEVKQFHFPVAVGLVGIEGTNLIGSDSDGTEILNITQDQQTFTFENVRERPVVSILRGFSAPVRVEPFQSSDDLSFLMKYDSDPFNRWDAANKLGTQAILHIASFAGKNEKPIHNEPFLTGLGHSLSSVVEDPALLALALQLPTETTLAQEVEVIDPDALYYSRQAVKEEMASRYQYEFLHLYNSNNSDDKYLISPEAMGKRSLRNTCLSYLMSLDPLPGEIRQLCIDQYRAATNMTDSIGALKCVVNLDNEVRIELLKDFYDKWQHDSLVLDKWFSLQATSSLAGTLNNVKHLLNNRSFSMENPNKIRSLIGAFCSGNHFRFHHVSGAGYLFLADMIISLNATNPQIAARLVAPLINWKRYNQPRQELMREQLDRIAAEKNISRDVSEIVNKSR